MNKLKVLLMLLLTMFLFESTTLKSYAAITDIIEIPEYSVSNNSDFYDKKENYLSKTEILKGDEGKLQKITIPNYSYCQFDSLAGEICLYTNNMKVITKSNYFDLFLPKGDYYISIEKFEKYDGYDAILYYGRASINNIMHNTITKSNKYYDVNYSFCCPPVIEAFMVKDFDHFYYGQDYIITLNLNNGLGNKYSKVTFDLCVNSKDSKVKATPTGTTKKIINAEKTGEEVSDTKKKDKKKPTVKGVKNNKTYKKAVKIKVSDKSGIKKVTLNGKKMKVSKFKRGYKIVRKKSTKKYVLKVWDKAGNKRVVKFKIKKK